DGDLRAAATLSHGQDSRSLRRPARITPLNVEARLGDRRDPRPVPGNANESGGCRHALHGDDLAVGANVGRAETSSPCQALLLAVVLDEQVVPDVIGIQIIRL